MVSVTRETPHSYDAEVYILGSIFLDNQVSSIVIGKLIRDDFYVLEHKKIYQAICNLYNTDTKIEPLTVIEECERQKFTFNSPAKNLILSIIDSVPSTASINLYVDIVKEKAIERELLSQISELSEDIYSNKLPFDELLDKTENTITQIVKKKRTSSILTIKKAAEKVYEQIASYSTTRNVKGLKTGFSGLDRATLGLQKGELIILAARPSVGKSAFALNLAVNVSRENTNPETNEPAHVAFFSLEMSIEQLMMRLYSYQSFISMSKIQVGNLDAKDMIRMGVAKKALGEYNIYFDESNSSKVYDIRSKCRQLKQAGKLDIVIIDYLQLVSGDNKGNRQEEVSGISRALKILAKELEVPVFALSQLSRLVETREDKKPVLSDLRESGSIEQDADVVMFLYRQENKKDAENFEVKEEVVEVSANLLDVSIKTVELSIAKNRQGALTNLTYNFLPAECRFKESRYTTKETKVNKQENQKSTAKDD